MLTEQEANTIINEFVALRKQTIANPEDTTLKTKFKRQERLCIDKLSYVVYMHASHYKAFNNYEDLCQEGFMALSRALFSYNPNKKVNPFWWLHKYVSTTIFRKSSLHSTIRYPLPVAKETPPHKESIMPVLIEKKDCPDLNAESHEVTNIILAAISKLPNEEQTVINLAYGFNGERPHSVNKICERLNLPRSVVKKNLKSALVILNQDIKL